MKNIHIIPTDKPSRLTKALHYNNVLRLVHENYKCDVKDEVFQNIYITSDEEIKDGDYIAYTILKNWIPTKYLGGDLSGFEKKIILTTDQDLIKDGIQAIDEEFLEWFVKNPSFEEVKFEEVKMLNYSFPRNVYNKYKIIIPKEEPKQEMNMSKIPTAEEFLQDHFEISHFYDDKTNQMVCFSSDVQKAMIEFAKFHLEAQTNKICHNMDISLSESQDAQKIVLNAYPLDNIK